ncbi:MAG: hypothetical protein RLZ83_558 [Pseudomonadota bacterium]
MNRRLACLLTLASAFAQPALAQTAQPLSIVVPFAPGGGADQYVRQMATAMGKYGLSAIVVNKPGGSGVIAATHVAKARPDGQTVLISSLTLLAINTLVFDKLPYDPAKDFVNLSLIGYQPALVVGRADLPYRNIKEMIEYARSRPGAINRGSTGPNTLANLALLRFEKAAGIQTTHVPFNGDPPALQALLGGNIDTLGTAITGVMAHVKSGKLRVLGVMDSQRLSQLPEVPTFKEMGHDAEALLWYALSAPSGTPRPLIDRLNQVVNQVMSDPEFIGQARAMGMEPRGGSLEDTSRFIARESEVWLPIYRSLNLPKQGG